MNEVSNISICGNCKKWLFGKCNYFNVDRDKNTVSCGIDVNKGRNKFKNNSVIYKRNELFRRKK